ALRALGPDVASFYILTPIPGTEQYDDFLREGRITETDLDRFDGTCPTWRHPALEGARLRDLLFRCYGEFYGLPDVAAKAARAAASRWDHRTAGTLLALVGLSVHARANAWMRSHPMAGGTARVRRDQLSDYLPLRRRMFGLERAPLPKSLALSRADQEINRTARLVG